MTKQIQQLVYTWSVKTADIYTPIQILQSENKTNSLKFTTTYIMTLKIFHIWYANYRDENDLISRSALYICKTLCS